MVLRSLIWVLCLAMPLTAVAPDESWVGLKVMNTKPKVRPRERVDGKVIEFDLTGSLLPVLEDRDGRLRVRDYLGKEGWADKADFVRLTDAPAFFTEVLRMDPQSVWAWTMRANAWPPSQAENAIR